MSYDNAALKPRSVRSLSSGIHLVHSRSWKSDDPRASAVRPPARQVRPPRQNPLLDTVALGAAAVAGPLVWVGHALLRWTRIL